MKKTARWLSLLLALTLALTPFAQALSTEDAKSILEAYYIDDLPKAAQDAQSLEALIAALGDPYTQYFTPQEYTSFLSSMEDSKLVGLGLSWQMTEEGGAIVRVFAGGAAANAGILAGDLMLKVGDTPLSGRTLDDIQPLLTGAENTSVTITLRHADGRTETVTLTRKPFTLPSTDVSLVDGHIGYLVCQTFGPETYGHFKDAITQNDGAVDRWIVDLRNNLGGEVQAAVDAMSAFAGGGHLSFLRDSSGEYLARVAQGGALTLDPVLVLMNENTASASELFAATIRDRQAGILIGSRSYGKGIAQSLLDQSSYPDLFPDGSALKVTTHRTFSQGGLTHDRMGVLPHVMVDDPNLTPSVAYLLSSPRPTGDSAGFLRLHIGFWRFYVNLSVATGEHQAGFRALLEGLAPGIELFVGKGGDTWEKSTLEEVAKTYCTGYVSPNFTDVAASPYADAINTLATFGIVSGSGDGTYAPTEALDRASLCALLAKAMGYPETPGKSTFADVPEDAWYTPHINTLAAMGIVNGWDDGLFHPDAPMNHEQFMVLLARTAIQLSHAAYAAWNADGPSEKVAAPDYASYDAWAQKYVALTDGFYYDEAKNIDPFAPTLREEAAASLYRLLVGLGVLVA